jgi:uncharacterized membrane protein
MKKRVWELDAFRGLCVLGMVIVHFVYDLIDLYALVDWEYPEWFLFVMKWGGLLFILISGICATLGRRSVRRGVIVVLCGLVCTAVTYGMYRFGMAGKGLIIYFGVLHCLGTCMILWWLFKRLPTWLLAVLGIAMAVAGLYLQTRTFDTGLWLMPLGFMPDGFASSDYFPLLPNLGYFLLGGVLGRTLYRKQETLLPKVNENNPVLRFLRLCGRHSLWIYLLHQPILSGICWLLSLLK